MADRVGGPTARPRSGTPCEGGEPARILVVDDDPMMLRYVHDALLRRVWTGRDYRELKKLVRAFVNKLRRNLGDDPCPRPAPS